MADLIFIHVMNIFSDPSFIQISVVLLILIGIAAYVRQFKAIAGLLGVYMIYILVSATFFTNEVLPISQISIPDSNTIQSETLTEQNHDPFIKGPDEESIQIEAESKKDAVIKEIVQKQIVPENNSTSANFQIQKMVMCNTVIVDKRTPEGIAVVFPDTIEKVYCFTIVQNLGEMQSVTHEWSLEGNIISIIPMNIGRSHYWRAWSYQSIQPHKAGNWTVTFRNNKGEALSSVDFSVVKIEKEN